MRQNTSTPRSNLPFQCFHTCTAPSELHNRNIILFVRGTSAHRLSVKLVVFPQHVPQRLEMLYTGSRYGIHRFATTMPLDEGSNIQRYCFKIALLNDLRLGIDAVWYSSLGISRERPLLSHCFAYNRYDSPASWSEDMICYHIVPDKFATSKDFFSVRGHRYDPSKFLAAKDVPEEGFRETVCGGDIGGIISMLPYLSSIGCDCIYLSPVFQASRADKSDVEDYDSVDEGLGGNAALSKLRLETQRHGIRMLLSAPIDHTSDRHPWFDRDGRTNKGAMRHKDSPFREYYSFNDNDEAAYFDQHGTLPKLNYGSKALRHNIYLGKNSFINKWLRHPYSIDGWVINDASQLGDNGNGRNNFKRLRQICRSARKTKGTCMLLGEFIADARYALTINTDQNLDGAINYQGFLSPMRSFFGGVDLVGSAIPYTGEDLRQACENYAVGMAQQTKLSMINQLDSPEVPRFFEIIGGEKNIYLSAIAVLYTYRGIPCLYQGDELGDIILQHGIGPHHPIPFALLQSPDEKSYAARVQQALKDLAGIRRSNPALTKGSLIFIASGGAYFIYIRLFQNRFSVIFVNASRQAMTIEQGSIMFPLLAAMYLPTDSQQSGQQQDNGETILIPLSGRNVRRTDRGEGLEALYELLAREKLSVNSFGFNKDSEKFTKDFLKELTAGKTITMPARSTVVVNNA